MGNNESKGLTLTEKIIKNHIIDGEMIKGTEIGLRIDQTLTQDATGTMAYLQFEAMGIDRVKTERSLAYIDHNTLQSGFENADDHRYIGSVAKKHGIYFSRPGNGICHQVHLERFGKPGKTLIGSDSHTPTGGGIGMLAMGAGGLDVAVAMGGGAYYITMPKVVKVNLTGKLNDWVSAKDVILKGTSDNVRKGRRRQGYRVLPVKALRACQRSRTCNYHQHGRGARRYHLYIPLRRNNSCISSRHRVVKKTSFRCQRRSRCRIR